MHTVFLTGASSGIGEAAAKMLLSGGSTVYGVGRDFSKTDPSVLASPSFHRICLDLRDRDALRKELDELTGAHVPFDVLICCAGSAYYGLHEQLGADEIEEMVRVDLLVPMELARRFLPRFKQQKRGTILNIASITAEQSANPHGAAYGACKAGLLSFSSSIFEEARKCGVKVTCILPDMTDTRLYRHADFAADPSEGAHLEPEDVAEAVRFVLEEPVHLCIPKLVISPQYRRIARKKEKTDPEKG